MPRSAGNVFKKRKGKFYPKKNVAVPNTEEKKCASEKKLLNLDESYAEAEECNSKSSEANIIIDLDILSEIFCHHVKCKECDGDSTLKLSIRMNSGLCVKLYLDCSECGYSYSFDSSNKMESDLKKYAVNTRFVYALRCIGKGAETGRLFCGVMNFPNPPTRFAQYTNKLKTVVIEVSEASMKEAVEEAVVENEDSPNLAVAVDGTWQKRGYTSLNGVLCVTSIDTGKALDVEVMSKFCLCKDTNAHLPTCKSNFHGVSGMMEVQGAINIFERSLEKYGVRYTKYLGDGDSKGHAAVAEKNIYGDDYPVEKLECIGHVQKRMGTRLRKLKDSLKGTTLSDGKGIGGRNRLTDEHIDLIQVYYGRAIKNNQTSVHEMQRAIWAIFLHKASTDQNPQHGFCPTDNKTWCGYNLAIQNNTTYVHRHSIPEAIIEKMKPTFKDLSHTDLLKKCLHGNTQNPNESLNNVIWSRVPKSTFVQIETLKLGAYDAVAHFNIGHVSKIRVLQKLGITPGKYMVSTMRRLDEERLFRAKYAHSQVYKDCRRQRRLKRKREQAMQRKNPKNKVYGSNLFY